MQGAGLQGAEVDAWNGHNVFCIHPIRAIERASGKRGLWLCGLLSEQLWAAEAIETAIPVTRLSI